MWCYPLAFSPLTNSPFSLFPNPFYLLGNPPCCDRIRPPWSQVACKPTSPSLTLPTPSPFQIPCTQVIYTPHYDDLKTPASPVYYTRDGIYCRLCVPIKSMNMDMNVNLNLNLNLIRNTNMNIKKYKVKL
jgi:hypothetical protein